MPDGGTNQVARDRFLFQDASGRYVVRNGRGDILGRYDDQANALSAAQGRIQSFDPGPEAGAFLQRESSIPREDFGQGMGRAAMGVPTRTDVRQSFTGSSPISPMQIRQAQGAVSMPGMETPMDGSSAGTANASINPALQQRYQQRRSPDEAFDFAGNRFTEEDFYAGSETPWETKASGGDPIFVATGGNVPLSGIMNTFAARADKLQKKKEELNQFIADRYKDFIGKADPRYDQKGQAWARSEMDKFVQDYANANTGGDVNLAYKSIYENPQAMAAYRAKAADVNAVLGVNKKVIPDALDVLSRVRKGEAQVSEQELARLLAAEQGRLSFDTDIPLSERADYAGHVEDRYSEQKWWKEYGQPAMEKAFDAIQKEGGIKYIGGRPFLRQEATTTHEKYIDSAAEEAVDLGIFRNIEDAKTYIRSHSPYKSEVTLSPLALGDRGGDGGGDRITLGRPEVGPDVLATEQLPETDRPIFSMPGIGQPNWGPVGHAVQSELTLPAQGPRESTPTTVRRAIFGPNGLPMTASGQFRDENGNTVTLIPSHIATKANGTQFIEGVDPSEIETIKANEAELANIDNKISEYTYKRNNAINGFYMKESMGQIESRLKELTNSRADIEKRIQKKKTPKRVPVKGNESMIPVDYDAIRSEAMSEFGSVSYEKMKGILPEGTTKADFDDAMSTPEGRMYIDRLRKTNRIEL